VRGGNDGSGSEGKKTNCVKGIRDHEALQYIFLWTERDEDWTKKRKRKEKGEHCSRSGKGERRGEKIECHAKNAGHDLREVAGIP